MSKLRSSCGWEGLPAVAVHVAVVDPLPMFRQGVVAVLAAAGFAVEEPADVLSWSRRVPLAIVLLTLSTEHDWRLLEGLRRADPQTAVIAFVEEGGAGLGVRAVRAGVRSVLPRHATAAALRRTVEAAVDGHSVLPMAVAIALANSLSHTDGHPMPSEDQLTWLRRISTGTTVTQLAGDTGYSERAMYRLLQALYQQMGVATRMQAVIRAKGLGWLDGP